MKLTVIAVSATANIVLSVHVRPKKFNAKIKKTAFDNHKENPRGKWRK